MYAALGLWTALALYAMVRDSPPLALSAALAGIYTHYAMLWTVPGILLLGLRRRPSRIRWALGLLAGAIPGGLHALWVGRTQGAFWPGTLDLGRALMALGQAQGLMARMAGFLPPRGPRGSWAGSPGPGWQGSAWPSGSASRPRGRGCWRSGSCPWRRA